MPWINDLHKRIKDVGQQVVADDAAQAPSKTSKLVAGTAGYSEQAELLKPPSGSKGAEQEGPGVSPLVAGFPTLSKGEGESGALVENVGHAVYNFGALFGNAGTAIGTGAVAGVSSLAGMALTGLGYLTGSELVEETADHLLAASDDLKQIAVKNTAETYVNLEKVLVYSGSGSDAVDPSRFSEAEELEMMGEVTLAIVSGVRLVQNIATVATTAEGMVLAENAVKALGKFAHILEKGQAASEGEKQAAMAAVTESPDIAKLVDIGLKKIVAPQPEGGGGGGGGGGASVVSRGGFLRLLFPKETQGMDTKEVMTWAKGSGLVTQGRGDAPINRAEAATLIMRKFNLASDAKEAHPFADVEPGSWYYEAAMACRRFGVFRGDAANQFSGSTALDPGAAFALVARCGAIRPLTGDEQRTLAGTW